MSVENETQACLHLATTNAVNIAQANVSHLLSRANRRLYPEDGTYMVRFRNEAIGSLTRLDIYTIKPTWRNMSALRLAKQAWLNATQQEYNALPKACRPKWRTWRAQGPLGAANLLYPYVFNDTATNTIGSSLDTAGEFVRSKVVTSAGTEMTLSVSTNDLAASELGIFDEWAKGKPATVPSPDAITESTMTTMAYQALDEEMSFELFDDIVDEGNLPPYDANTPHGQQYHRTILEIAHDADWTPWIAVPSGWFVLNATTAGENLDGGGICMQVKETKSGVWFKPFGRTVKEGDKYRVVRS